MGLFKKFKDILFDEEEYTEQIKITPEMRNEDAPMREKPSKPVKEIDEIKEEVKVEKQAPVSERELFKTAESSFPFLDFDEDEFEGVKNVPKQRVVEPEPAPQKPRFAIPSKPKQPTYETTVKTTRTTDYGSYTKTVTTEERKKFKPSPIISPVYGILNKDYQKEDIIKKTDLLDMDVQRVRDKAFGEKPKVEEKKEEPVVPKTTFYEQTITIKTPDASEPERVTKSIDELLEETDMPMDVESVINTVPDLPEVPDYEPPVSLEQEEPEIIPDKHVPNETEDTLENDLFDLIDSMYDSKED